MSRIDVQTLVASLEQRIEALNKNPIDLVPQKTILKILQESVDSLIKENFINVIRRDIKVLLRKQLKGMKKEFVEKTVRNILKDKKFREGLERKVKNSVLESIKYVR